MTATVPNSTPLPKQGIRGPSPEQGSDSAGAGGDTRHHRHPAEPSDELVAHLMRHHKQPKLRLDIHDVDHPGARRFLDLPRPHAFLNLGVRLALSGLYNYSNQPEDTDTYSRLRPPPPPPVRVVTLRIKSKPGSVAATWGDGLDDMHKTVEVSSDFLANIPQNRIEAEVSGVLIHELVHCFQYNAGGTCPVGLIEGIADWVRLVAGFAPPHWKRTLDGQWDAGYASTAYFLEYLETRCGRDTVRRINGKLSEGPYDEKIFWPELLGASVHQLWADYCEKHRPAQ